MSRARPRTRRPAKGGKRDLQTITAVVLAFAAVAAANWLDTHRASAAGIAALLAATGAWWVWRRVRGWLRAWRNRSTAPTGIAAYRLAEPGDFERQLAALCRRDGCTDVRVVGGAGDLAADVLYTDPRGRRALIQAKRYRRGNTVGSEHVQRVNGTYRDAHRCTHAAIVTTSTFTADARAFAQHVGIALLDESRLAAWAAGRPGAAPWN